MSTGVLITLIICLTLVAIIATVVIAAVIMQKKAHNAIKESQKEMTDIFKEF